MTLVVMVVMMLMTTVAVMAPEALHRTALVGHRAPAVNGLSATVTADQDAFAGHGGIAGTATVGKAAEGMAVTIVTRLGSGGSQNCQTGGKRQEG